MITEDYCSFEVAKLLKERGFNGGCSTFYRPDGNIRYGYEHCHNFNISDRIDCPTIQMAMKWLREVHNTNIILDMVPLNEDSYALWTFNVYCNRNYKIIWGPKQPKYNTYEQAIEAALKYCLTNLIK